MDQKNAIEKRLTGLSSLIGNTPLLEIKLKYKGDFRLIYAKAEFLNMTGSIKDRMTFHIMERAYARNTLKAGDTIVEATSGNTGISFSALGRALGHKVKIFMPDWLSTERINLIRSLGAEIQLVSKEEGGFLKSIELAKNLSDCDDCVYLPSQFSNEDNVETHYLGTGPELWWQLRFRSLKPNAFIAGVGTGGTIMGIGRYLKEQDKSIRIYPLEPYNSPTLSTGHKVGKHRIQGISDEFIPSIVDLESLDPVVSVDDGDAIIMASRLASELGIGVGISSGANLLGALKVQEMMGKDKTVVTVFPDDNKKYLSTDLLKEEPVKDLHLSKDIELVSFRSFKRVCHTCCDPENCLERNFEGDPGVRLPQCARRS
ncbi:MAG: cysteine synthase [Bacteroidetes bacterium]|nr:MAG: cysteine synthase [Bacteroidota bacterium]